MKPTNMIKLLLVASALLLIPRRSSRQIVNTNINTHTNNNNKNANVDTDSDDGVVSI